jgi:hypothetical protein
MITRSRFRLAMVVGVAAAIAAAVAAYVIRGPSPLAFAGGETVALADYREANPTGVPASLAKASLVDHGAYLARAADCIVCHTKPGGKELAGGLGFKLPFGTLYSTNITPDKETGIGNYSDAEFLDAVRRGIRRDGALLYPPAHRRSSCWPRTLPTCLPAWQPFSMDWRCSWWIGHASAPGRACR